MARWKLLQPHYINVPGTKWEYQEISRTTGKPVRKDYPVPLYLNPEDQGDCNQTDGMDKILVVSNGGTHDERDYMFTGQPTPDMEPLDDEARVISDKLRPGWSHAINDLPSNGNFSQAMVDVLQAKMNEAKDAPPPSPQIEGMSELLQSMKMMMEQNAAVLATLAAQRPGVAGGDLRKV